MEDLLDEYYKEYIKLDGKHNIELFNYNLNVFFSITQEAFTGGNIVITRDKAFNKWKTFIGSLKEANLYFDAVDNITSYS
jgi:hypothetical protein